MTIININFHSVDADNLENYFNKNEKRIKNIINKTMKSFVQKDNTTPIPMDKIKQKLYVNIRPILVSIFEIYKKSTKTVKIKINNNNVKKYLSLFDLCYQLIYYNKKVKKFHSDYVHTGGRYYYPTKFKFQYDISKMISFGNVKKLKKLNELNYITYYSKTGYIGDTCIYHHRNVFIKKEKLCYIKYYISTKFLDEFNKIKSRCVYIDNFQNEELTHNIDKQLFNFNMNKNFMIEKYQKYDNDIIIEYDTYRNNKVQYNMSSDLFKQYMQLIRIIIGMGSIHKIEYATIKKFKIITNKNSTSIDDYMNDVNKYSINLLLPIMSIAFDLFQNKILTLYKKDRIKLIKIIHTVQYILRYKNNTLIEKIINKIIFV